MICIFHLLGNAINFLFIRELPTESNNKTGSVEAMSKIQRFAFRNNSYAPKINKTFLGTSYLGLLTISLNGHPGHVFFLYKGWNCE